MKLINKEIIDNKWSQNEYELDSLNLGKEPELIGVVIANIIILNTEIKLIQFSAESNQGGYFCSGDKEVVSDISYVSDTFKICGLTDWSLIVEYKSAQFIIKGFTDKTVIYTATSLKNSVNIENILKYIEREYYNY